MTYIAGVPQPEAEKSVIWPIYFENKAKNYDFAEISTENESSSLLPSRDHNDIYLPFASSIGFQHVFNASD